MEKITKYGWWTLVIISLVFAVGIYLNNGYKINKEEVTQETKKYSQQEMGEAIIYFNKSEEFEKALVLAEEYVSQYPEDIEGWIHRGYAYMGLGNCIEASANFYHASVNGYEEASQLLTYVANSDICKEATQF